MSIDIADWLRGLTELEQYAQLFRDNDIDGEILSGMNAEDLKELGLRRFGAKPAKTLSMIRRRARVHGRRLAWRSGWPLVRSMGFGLWGPRARAEWLSRSEQRFDGFIAQVEERRHRTETARQRLVAASLVDPADDLFAAEFF